MSTAFLIMAHHQPGHLAKLIDALQADDVTFFIHIDAKVDEAPFRKAVDARNNVVFTGNRRDVYWCGFSFVEATLAILEEAMNASQSFRRFCLLSGSDFPIKSKQRIRSALATNHQFIRVDRSVGPTVINMHTDNVRRYWLMDSWGPIRRRLGGRLRRRQYDEIELYQGSAWWALTRDCADHIFAFLSSHCDYRSFFKFTRCPDEIFFQSIIKASPFASEITQDFEASSNLPKYFVDNDHGSHYIDWNAEGERLPKVLDLADLDALLNSTALFARKFEEQRSRPLIAELQRILAG